MKLKQVKKWLLRIIFVLVIISIVGVIISNYELKHMYGGYTEMVDTSQFNVVSKPTTITNVSILSSDGSYFIENQTVWLEKGKIVSIDTVPDFPENIATIDGGGKYLIPGLIDSHVHLWQSPNDLLLYLANGVTHIREMMGSPEHLKWRQEIEKGKRLGPKMFVASNKIQSFGLLEGWFMNWIQGNINLNKTENAISTLQLLSNDGYDAVKLGSLLNKENYMAVNFASDKVGIPLIGHLSLSVGLTELWNSNQKEVAHIEEIVKALRIEFGRVNSENSNEFLQFVQRRSSEVADNLVKHKIAVISTLLLTESFSKQKFELDTLLKEIKLPYANPGLIEGTLLTSRGLGWLPEVNLYRLPESLNAKEQLSRKVFWNTYTKAHQIILKAMIDKGVRVLAGTDSNIPIMVPGFALHNELKSLTQSGMSPSQALHSATTVPAKWMKIESGKILPNYRADLVLLNKNPLDNIENTKSIEMVILNGKVFNRSQLDAILNAVIEANNRSRNKEISLFVD